MIGPRRPRNISPASTSGADGGSWAVMPVESPTVAKADTTSNWTSFVGTSVVADSTRVAMATAATESSATVSAWRMTRSPIRRWNTSTSFSPRTSA